MGYAIPMSLRTMSSRTFNCSEQRNKQRVTTQGLKQLFEGDCTEGAGCKDRRSDARGHGKAARSDVRRYRTMNVAEEATSLPAGVSAAGVLSLAAPPSPYPTSPSAAKSDGSHDETASSDDKKFRMAVLRW